MTADERLASVMVKIERAKQHVLDVQGAVRAFLETDPYGVVEKVDPQLGKMSYEIDRVERIPAFIAAISGDALQNLRSALDHLVYQLLLVQLNVDFSEVHLNFPIRNTAKEYESLINGKIQQRLRADAVEALREVEAYKGGNGHGIWTLNRLNNIDKHRIIITVGSASRSVNLGGMMSRHLREFIRRSGAPDAEARAAGLPQLDAFFRGADNMCPLKVGDVLISNLEPDMKFDAKRDFRFDVAINKPQVIERKPLIETLQYFCDLIGGIATSFRPCLA